MGDNENIQYKKRKRRVISDDENEEDENDGAVKEYAEEVVSEKDIVCGDESDNDEHVENAGSDDESNHGHQQTNRLFDNKGRLRKDFLENEAELSGSDDEFSEDEDEHGLDRLELEEGDMEEIDEQLEMDKVGRLHQKVLLDEDQADIRLFQERFLEDGDLHTDNKRQRQFKWKGLDEDIEVAKPDSDGEEEELGIDETWRLETMERK